MEGMTLLELIGAVLGGGSVIGFFVGLLTIKWQRLKAKAEAKGADAEADMKRQDYYQEVIDDLRKDRERMKEIREEQEQYISELKADRAQLRSEKEELRRENNDLREMIHGLQETQRQQGDKIARLGRIVKSMTPIICTETSCKKRQGDIIGLVADDSFDVAEDKKKKTKK